MVIFPVAETEESTCNAGNPVHYLGRKDPLEKRMAIHSSIFAQGNPMERGAVATVLWIHRVRHN